MIRLWLLLTLSINQSFAANELCPSSVAELRSPAERAEKLRLNYAATLVENFRDYFDSDSVKGNLQQQLNSCLSSLSLSPSTPGLCLGRAHEMVREMERPLLKDDKNEHTQIPSWVVDSPKIQSLMRAFDYAGLRAEIAKLNNTRPPGDKILIMQTRSSIPSMQSNDSRIVIVDPANRGNVSFFTVDRTRNMTGANDLLGMISYNPTTRNWYANDHEHANESRGVTHGSQDKKYCTRCHSSGPISFGRDQVIGAESLADWTQAQRLFRPDLTAVMNDGRPQNKEAMGPGLGRFLTPAQAKAERNPAFFKKCLSQYPAGRDFMAAKDGEAALNRLANKLRPMMNCASCHNGTPRPAMPSTAGTLRFPLGLAGGPAGEHDNVHFRIMNGDMPKPGPGNWKRANLNPFEAKALVNCLAYENYGVVPDPDRDLQGTTLRDEVRNSQLYKWLSGDCGRGPGQTVAPASDTGGEGAR